MRVLLAFKLLDKNVTGFSLHDKGEKTCKLLIYVPVRKRA